MSMSTIFYEGVWDCAWNVQLFNVPWATTIGRALGVAKALPHTCGRYPEHTCTLSASNLSVDEPEGTADKKMDWGAAQDLARTTAASNA